MAVLHLDEPQPPQSGFALFNLGFRPFFLGAALLAFLIQPVWLLVLAGKLSLPAYYGDVGWHVHEMIFAYSAAVIAGFLLTAASNWTGAPVLKDRPLALLTLLWLVGRVLPFLSFVPPWVIALVDFLFLPLLGVVLFKPIFKIKQWRNIAFPLFVFLMAAGNGLVHGEALGLFQGTAQLGFSLALYVVLFIIVLMAGRVVPFFIERGAEGAKTRKWQGVEVLALASIGLLGVVEILVPGSSFGVWLAGIAAVVHLVRWAGWISPPLFRVPLLWVLVSGYFWIVLGLVLLFLAGIANLPKGLALHAFTVGGIGVLTIGMMARVSLGHTGRMLQPHSVMAWSFALINLAVVVRVLVPLMGGVSYEVTVAGATLLWELAFLLFLVIYTPILIRPRVDGRPY